jgi:hypothetical protein
MKLVNPLKSLTWNRLFHSSGSPRRLRKRAPAAPSIAAEVLEVRSLLSSANVAAIVAGTTLTLTSDNNGDHSVNAYRLDANHVEVDAAAAGTTINGAASAVFNLTSVSGIVVNLGSAYERYSIFTKSGDPALNVGGGGVLFQGAGSAGVDLEVDNQGTFPMSILGNVAVQGATAGSALTINGSAQSLTKVYNGSASPLTVAGSVSINEIGNGTGALFSDISTQGPGDLKILGAVTSALTETGSGNQTNCVSTEAGGSISIGLGLTQSTSGGSGQAGNQVFTDAAGSIAVGQGITQNATGVSGEVENYVATGSSGNLTVNFGLAQAGTSFGDDVANNIVVKGGGNLTVGVFGGGISQAATSVDEAVNSITGTSAATGSFSTSGDVMQTASSAYEESNTLENDGSGSFHIGGQIKQAGTGSTAYGTTNSVDNNSSAALQVGLWVDQSGASTFDVSNSVLISGGRSGNLSVGAWITQTATGANLTNLAYDAGSGNFSVGAFVSQKATGTIGGNDDAVYASSSGNVTIGGGGININESSTQSGANDYNKVYTSGSGRLATSGFIVITADNSAAASFISSINYVQASQNPTATLSALGIVFNISGTQKQTSNVLVAGAAMNIGAGGISWHGAGSGYHSNSIYANANYSPITIAGSVDCSEFGSGHSEFDILSDGNNSPVTIGGNVSYYDGLNTVSHSDVYLFGNPGYVNSVLTIGGSLFITLAQTTGTAADSRYYQQNTVFLGGIGPTLGFGTVVNGATVITGGNGQDDVTIRQALLKLGGAVNLMGNPNPGSTWFDDLEIDGSTFGAGFTAILSGPNAEIDINHGLGNQATVFSGFFQAIMTGSHPVIYVADGAGAGYSPVAFNAGALVVGSPGGGGQLIYGAANVTGPIFTASFTKIPV